MKVMNCVISVVFVLIKIGFFDNIFFFFMYVLGYCYVEWVVSELLSYWLVGYNG